jgi:hypothetical protein
LAFFQARPGPVEADRGYEGCEGSGADNKYSETSTDNEQAGFQAASRAFDLAFDFKRPVKPRWPEFDIDSAVQTGMDAGLAALGQGWPFAAARRINVGLRACRA